MENLARLAAALALLAAPVAAQAQPSPAPAPAQRTPSPAPPLPQRTPAPAPPPAPATSAPAPDAAAPAAEQPTPEQLENIERAFRIVRAFNDTFELREASDAVKAQLLMCLYNRPLAAIAAEAGQVFANSPILDPANPDDFNRVAAAVCGVVFRRNTPAPDPSPTPRPTTPPATEPSR